MGNFGQFDIAPPAYGQNVGEEEEEQEEKVEKDTNNRVTKIML